MENTNAKLKVYIALGALQAFIGLGALAGGIPLVMDPSGSILGLPSDFIDGTIFPNYLIPGIFLLAVNGVGSIIGAGFSFARNRYAKEIAVVLGAILVAWIVIQIITIKSFHWLQVLYFILGVVELGIGMYIRRRQFQAV